MSGTRPGPGWKMLRALCHLHECYLCMFDASKGTVVLSTPACCWSVMSICMCVCAKEIYSSLLLAESCTEHHRNFRFPWGCEVHLVQFFLRGHNLSCL